MAAGDDDTMTKQTPPAEPVRINLDRPDTSLLRHVAGASKDTLNNHIIKQVIDATWAPKDETPTDRVERATGAVLALQAFGPRDAIEGMLAAQAVALHEMSMELARRAMLPQQPSETAAAMRKGAVQASRGFVELLDALDRRRGKGGKQHITVKHLHVSDDARAVIGNFGAGGGEGHGAAIDGEARARGQLEGPPSAGAILPEVRGKNPERQPVPRAGSARKTTVSDARRAIDGAAHG